MSARDDYQLLDAYAARHEGAGNWVAAEARRALDEIDRLRTQAAASSAVLNAVDTWTEHNLGLLIGPDEDFALLDAAIAWRTARG